MRARLYTKRQGDIVVLRSTIQLTYTYARSPRWLMTCPLENCGSMDIGPFNPTVRNLVVSKRRIAALQIT